jgi:hypothetical protein
MTSSDSPKLIYVAQRHPRLAPADFTSRWRQHAALGMSQPRWRNVALYLHCDRIEGLPVGAPALDCDGVAVVVYRSEGHRQAHVSDRTAGPIMKADELETFAQPVAQTALLTRSEAVVAPASGNFRLFIFWPAASSGFGARWPAAAPQWRSRLQVGVGLVCNHPIQGAGELKCGGIDEFCAASPEPLVLLAESLLGESQLPGEASLVLTQTAVLHDQPVP